MFEKLCECGKSKKSFKYDLFERFHNSCCDEVVDSPKENKISLSVVEVVSPPIDATTTTTTTTTTPVLEVKQPDVISPFLPKENPVKDAPQTNNAPVVNAPPKNQSNKTRGRKPTKTK